MALAIAKEKKAGVSATTREEQLAVVHATTPEGQLIERIIRTEPFQKSTRLPALLRYLAAATFAGDRDYLTEQKIGTAVLGKAEDYTPSEDSAVRVHVRQLRLRLHEYFDSEGRMELINVQIPKGGYTLLFTASQRSLEASGTPAQVPAFVSAVSQLKFWLPFALVVALISAFGWYHAASEKQANNTPPWPLGLVMQPNTQTTVVVADIGYALRMIGNKEVPLDQYVDRSYVKDVVPPGMDPGIARLIHYLQVSQITSIADAHAAATLTKLAGKDAESLVIRSARDLNPHSFDRGNFIFVGTKTSNPWTALFESRLNFHFVEDFPGGPRYIVNESPRDLERKLYIVPENTGSSGEDFATISIFPSRNGSGNVLLLQGLRLEGTEAVIQSLEREETRTALKKQLILANGGTLPMYFEALLHATSLAGAPISIEYLSVRILKG